MKKAQGISINTIIIAALGLAVLVVLFLIFTGRISIFSQGIENAQRCNDVCSAAAKTFQGPAGAEGTCSIGQYVSGKYSDGPNGCCCR